MTDFATVFGRTPDVIWAAPGRVNVIGEHTDYNDGFSLPIALPMRTTAAIARRADAMVRFASAQRPGEVVEIRLDDLRPGSAEGWAGYAAGVVWSLREAGHPVGGLDVLVDGQVPEGSGLSSSAALECAVGMAVADAFALDISRPDMVLLAQRAENEFVGAPTGIMDQSASLLCQAAHALLLDARTQQTRQVPFDLAAVGLTIVVIDTRAPHAHVDSEYAQRRATCEAAAAALGVAALRDIDETWLDVSDVLRLDGVTRRRVRHVVTENARTLRTAELLADGRVSDIGPLLTASHASLRDDYEVTVPQLDVAVDAALGAGAFGARMTGGGFGGCAIALISLDAATAVETAVRRAYAAHDFAEPRFFAAPPSDGALRLR
jgi:galactokinase